LDFGKNRSRSLFVAEGKGREEGVREGQLLLNLDSLTIWHFWVKQGFFILNASSRPVVTVEFIMIIIHEARKKIVLQI